MSYEKGVDHDGLLEGFTVSETIEPALTAGEWASKTAPVGMYSTMVLSNVALHLELCGPPGTTRETEALDERERHAIAALALYGQPFGFTRERLGKLRLLIDKATSLQDEGPWGEGWQSRELEEAIKSARQDADRIEALLPPEGK
jgi:hypothetical protein